MLLIGRVGADVDRSFLVRWWSERNLERKWLRIGTPCVSKHVQMAAERMGGAPVHVWLDVRACQNACLPVGLVAMCLRGWICARV